jgi:hypothetical protein
LKKLFTPAEIKALQSFLAVIRDNLSKTIERLPN